MTARHWIFAVTLDALILILFCAWQIEGVESAGTFLIGVLWVISALSIIAAFAPARKAQGLPSTFYHAITNVLIVLGIVYVGHVWLAAAYMFGWWIVEARRLAADPSKAAK